MNVIVSYKQKDIIDNANIDAIKDLNGLFNVDDLILKFKNYFFSKMILDVTSVDNFTSREVLQKLVDGIGPDRLILLLPQTPPPPNEFKKMLIDLGIYNFSNEISDVVKYIDNPNTYEMALKLLDESYFDNNTSDGYVDNSIKGDDNSQNFNDFSGNINDSSNSSFSLQSALSSFDVKDDENMGDTNSDFTSSDNSEQDNQISESTGNNFQESINDLKVENNDSYNLDYNHNINNMHVESSNLYDSLKYNNTGEQTKDDSSSLNSSSTSPNKSNYVFLNMNGFGNRNTDKKKVIGFKNVTLHAGSTSLVYMLLKALIDFMKKDVLAVEVNRDEFKLFMNDRMMSVPESDIKEFITSRHEEIILVDLNECNDTSFCDDVIYLVEPSTIMLNKLMFTSRDIFANLSNKKVVLNKSFLSNDDIKILSSEAGINFFYNINALNDRIINDEIIKFIDVLGIK